MPIFTKKKCSALYLHVPKTGGTAIEEFFSRNGFATDYIDTGGSASINRLRRCAPQHFHAEPILATLRPTQFDYVFMTVRHPLARVLSEYRMRLGGKGGKPPSLPIWLDQMFRRFPEDGFVGENHIRPQSAFWLPGCEVYRQEDGYGPALVSRIEDKLAIDLDHRTIGKFNLAIDTELDAADIEQIEPRVRQFYRQDYVNFGY